MSVGVVTRCEERRKNRTRGNNPSRCGENEERERVGRTHATLLNSFCDLSLCPSEVVASCSLVGSIDPAREERSRSESIGNRPATGLCGAKSTDPSLRSLSRTAGSRRYSFEVSPCRERYCGGDCQEPNSCHADFSNLHLFRPFITDTSNTAAPLPACENQGVSYYTR